MYFWSQVYMWCSRVFLTFSDKCMQLLSTYISWAVCVLVTSCTHAIFVLFLLTHSVIWHVFKIRGFDWACGHRGFDWACGHREFDWACGHRGFDWAWEIKAVMVSVNLLKTFFFLIFDIFWILNTAAVLIVHTPKVVLIVHMPCIFFAPNTCSSYFLAHNSSYTCNFCSRP